MCIYVLIYFIIIVIITVILIIVFVILFWTCAFKTSGIHTLAETEAIVYVISNGWGNRRWSFVSSDPVTNTAINPTALQGMLRSKAEAP